MQIKKLLSYQTQMIQSPYIFPDTSVFMISGGYGCLREDGEILTPNGKIKIKNLKENDIVYSFNEETKQIEYDTCSAPFTRGVGCFYKITLSNGNSLICSTDHRIYTSKGWTKADNLTLSSYPLVLNKSNKLDFEPIINIEFVGSFTRYDIEVYKNHNYISNGFINHNCGKTDCLVDSLLFAVQNLSGKKTEAGHRPLIMLCGSTINFMKKTSLLKLEQTLQNTGTEYKWNKADNIINIGDVDIIVVPCENPDGIYGYDASCLCENTLIATKQGKKKIKDITTKDFVLTRQGYKRVVENRYMGQRECIELSFTNGSKIICTPDHRFITIKDVKFADNLDKMDLLITKDTFAVMTKKTILDKLYNVYDIEVEDCHEYFANDILVHNCCFWDEMDELPAEVSARAFDRIQQRLRQNIVDFRTPFLCTFCLAGDTKIPTSKGIKAIKDIQKGDYVLTRNGYKKVINKFNNGIKDTYSLNGIYMTLNHRLLTKQSFVDYDNLKFVNAYDNNGNFTNEIKCFKEKEKKITQNVYDIEVEDIHEYFVLDNNGNLLCSHNSTAQGLSGMYNKYIEMKKQKMPFVLIKARTKDNIYLDRSYVNALYSSMSPARQKAELEGEFVAIDTYNVFAEYDKQRHLLDEDFYPKFLEDPEYRNAKIYIGQDFNKEQIGNNAVAACVIDNAIVFVKDYNITDMSAAAQIFRTDFPTQQIYWIPDTTGTDKISAVRAIFQNPMYNIKIISGKNPPITDRVVACNTLFHLDRMFICPVCEDLERSVLLHKYAKDGKIKKGSESAPDHKTDCMGYIVSFILANNSNFYDIYRITLGRRFGYNNRFIPNQDKDDVSKLKRY